MSPDELAEYGFAIAAGVLLIGGALAISRYIWISAGEKDEEEETAEQISLHGSTEKMEIVRPAIKIPKCEHEWRSTLEGRACSKCGAWYIEDNQF